MPQNQSVTWIAVAVTVLAAVAVYAPGLDGPFLFDDGVHITQNRWVKIDTLDWHSLVQAWQSSFSPFPGNRPLAQLSFGINHALGGLDPWGFKSVNLVLHLLTGLGIFLFARLGVSAGYHGVQKPPGTDLLPLVAMALWLLHPLHVSTVLYTVQRMSQLSTLFLLLALCVYFAGRLRIAEGRPGLLWLLAATPLAAIGFLGKENAVLLPLLLLACEMTLLRSLPIRNGRWQVRSAWLVLIAIPLLLGTTYLITHPGLLNHDGRPFTFEERILTQPRVLWWYLRWLFIPDITQLGLFHDDIPISRGLLEPPTTLIAIIGLTALLIAALLSRTRWPVFSFAVLFFFAAHALESTIFPLEMVFEHRNYLASIGPLLLLAYLVTVGANAVRFAGAVRLLTIALMVAYAVATYVRANDWRSHESFVLSSAERHPNSARAQFMAGQLAISLLPKIEEDRSEMAAVATQFLEQGLAANPRCLNCLFGLVVLDLHLERTPHPEKIERLVTALKAGPVDASLVSVSQFSYLVDWIRVDGDTLSRAQLEAIFDAALKNPNWNGTGRGGIEAAYRKYHELVTDDMEAALVHARAAVAAWPSQWSYHVQLVDLLRKLDRKEEARAALQRAAGLSKNDEHHTEIARLKGILTQPDAQ
jgi:hypothetical protein